MTEPRTKPKKARPCRSYVIGWPQSRPDSAVHIFDSINNMADDEIATKAPESDAQESQKDGAGESVFPGDSRAQDGPSMGVSFKSSTPFRCGY